MLSVSAVHYKPALPPPASSAAGAAKPVAPASGTDTDSGSPGSHAGMALLQKWLASPPSTGGSTVHSHYTLDYARYAYESNK
jgi:hypothetical protein